MQQEVERIQSFVDVRGLRWRALPEARALLEERVAPWLARSGSEAAPDGGPLRPLKLSKRREVYAALAPGLPPLLLKRYPPRAGLLGRGRDWLRTRAAAELRAALAFARAGLAVPRPLGCAEPPPARAGEPSWFVSVRLLGALPLGDWLERRFRPGDGAAAKLNLARRALDELAKVHRAGFWHRDFHGGNLLLREGEGPAARLFLIDLHAALELGSVPQRLRARDAADLLHSLRYAFSDEEVAELAAGAARLGLDPELLRTALERKREAQARSRGARAFVESSRFAQARLGSRRVSHVREVDPAAIEKLIAGHAAALVRSGRRSRLSRQPLPGGGEAFAKELLGRFARRRARAAFAHAVAAQARDLPAAAPLACVTGGAGEPAFFVARAVEDATPLHLLAQRTPRDEQERRLAAAIARRILELLVALVRRRFVHPDLSAKNLLVRRRGEEVELVLVDLDAARPGARFTRRRLLRALAQLGDVPERAFSRAQRLRWLRQLIVELELTTDPGSLARATSRLLRRRRRLLPMGAPRHDLAAGAATPTLHFFGNWKWTGPAEPALALAEALAPGARLLLGRCPHPDLGQPVAERAAARSVPHEVLAELRKHWNPLRTGAAAAEALPIAKAQAPAVLHVHLDGDHAVAEAVARELPQRPALVRHVHSAGPHRARARRLLRRAELLVAPAAGLARELERELSRPEFDVASLETSVDLARFRFREELRARGRARLGLGPEEVAFGIVARIQPHRRFELLFEAWARLAAAAGGAGGGRAGGAACPKLVVLGRGTREAELAHEPVRRLGLERCVLLSGYQEGEAYVEALAACDAGILLVPGTDVSCRAAREWMAMGRPVVATRRPPLPELIEDGADGRLVDESAEALAAAVLELSRPERLEAAGERAAFKAAERFDPRRLRAHARALDRMAVLALPGAAQSFRGRADVVAAARPGRIEAVLRLAGRGGFELEQVLAFDPARSRDAVLDLFALLHEARPRLALLEPHPELDGTLAAELRRAVGEAALLVSPGGGGEAGPLARELPCVEA